MNRLLCTDGGVDCRCTTRLVLVLCTNCTSISHSSSHSSHSRRPDWAYLERRTRITRAMRETRAVNLVMGRRLTFTLKVSYKRTVKRSTH